MQGSLVTAMETMARPGADPMAVAAACEQVIGWAHARQLEALNQVACEQPDYIDPTGALVDPAPAEVATGLAWSTGTAARRLNLASEICHELPDLLEALRHGQVRPAQSPGDHRRHGRTRPHRPGATGRCGCGLRHRTHPRATTRLADPPDRRD